MEETVFDGTVFNYVIVYIDTIIDETNDLEMAIKKKAQYINDSFYLKKDKIKIYARIDY